MSELACSLCGKGTENMRLLKRLTRVELESDKLRYERDELRKVADGAMVEADKLTRDVASLQAENAKLRGEVERLHAEQAYWELGNCPSCPNVVSLQEALEQNAKLRELMRDMWEYIYVGTAQDGQSLHDRTRSLGIEVPS